MLGLVVGISINRFLYFIYRFLESTLNLNINQLISYEFDILIFWFALIFTPIVFFFLLKNSHNLKSKIVRTTLFLIGNLLGFVMLFFYIIFQCGMDYPYLYPTKYCMEVNPSLIPTIIFVIILGIDIVYLIFRFVDYLRTKNSK